VPSKFEVFAVYEPKRRMVHAPRICGQGGAARSGR
jgi:hypothetical protein